VCLPPRHFQILQKHKKEKEEVKAMTEICNECGQPVHASSGKYVNRVIDFNGYKTRRETGKPFPEGDYICAGCETATDAQTATVLHFPLREENKQNGL
jgi:hypothetical protein